MSGIGRRMAIAAAGLGAAGAAAAAFRFGVGGEDQTAVPQRQPKTTEVTRATLVDVEEITSEIGFGDPVPLRFPAPGEATGAGLRLVTWLPLPGSMVDRGGTLLRVDNAPVVLLFGPIPLYRTLLVGIKGPDVRQLKENLRALNQRLTVDDSFTQATAATVKRWQRALGTEETGTIAPGQVLYAAGAIRVASHTLLAGDRAEGEILRYTATDRLVTVPLSGKHLRVAIPDAAVTVVLGDGRTADGVIASVTALPPAGPGEPVARATVMFTDQQPVRAQPPGPVTVRIVVLERKDVLTVPVVALVALAEGGYGVEVVSPSGRRYVAVETGMFAGGRVEVRSGSLAPGTAVVVPK